MSIVCPCGTGTPFKACCGMYHNTPGTAPTAETLMRSRYAAFAIGDFNYIVATQKLESDIHQSVTDIQDSSESTQWIKLEINATEDGLEKDKTGVVAFSAHFKEGKHSGRLSERSTFKKIEEQWFYISGEHEIQKNTPLVHADAMKIGRNDPCLCGSGKKFKKCCATQ